VNSVCFSAFELVRKHLSPTSRPSGHALILNTISTPLIPCNSSLLLRDGPDLAKLMSFSSAQPPHATLSCPRALTPQEEVTAKGEWRRGRERGRKREREKRRGSRVHHPVSPPSYLLHSPRGTNRTPRTDTLAVSIPIK
jgi:hypothetical protein